jgi:hypothetical protein
MLVPRPITYSASLIWLPKRDEKSDGGFGGYSRIAISRFVTISQHPHSTSSSDGLFLPVDYAVWQGEELNTNSSRIQTAFMVGKPWIIMRELDFTCAGHGIFGYFLTLMIIFGEIVALRHANTDPALGIMFEPAQ